MRAAWLTSWVLAGCQYVPGIGTPDHDGGAQPDGPCVSYSTVIDSCTLTFGAPLTLSGQLTFNTNTGDLFQDATPIEVETATLITAAGEIKAILAARVELTTDTKLRAEGSRGFAILASESIQLFNGAVIDVAVNGAGARTACPEPSTVGTDRDGGAGGGGGGGLGGAGGTGGAGDQDSTTPAPGGSGGFAPALPDGIVGGCPGSDGGNDNNDPGGRGGVAGGAVFLAAGQRIEVAAGAGIDAAGEGGIGGSQHGVFNGDAGGGGGGSGGMIVLEAPMVVSVGTFAANGGGGGEGSGNTNGGRDGARGPFGITRANGGSGGSSTGSNGGTGGAKPDRAGASVTTPLAGGGGGGGGGAGVIRILAPAGGVNASISPDPS